MSDDALLDIVEYREGIVLGHTSALCLSLGHYHVLLSRPHY